MLLPIQTQAYLLYGSGAIIGDTTIILASFNDIDGNALSMQGTVMTGTIEPNSGSSEEQILFTGVTQNSNGTATLTGVKSVGFASPYTQTTGVVKSHAGNTTFVLSDTAYLYSQYAGLGNTQTFTGTDTFTIAPVIPTVGSSQIHQAASVEYVNAAAFSGGVKASDIVYGISKLSTAPSLASEPTAVGTNDNRVSPVSLAALTAGEVAALAGDNGTPGSTNTYMTQSGYQNGSENFSITAGTSTAFTITLGPTPTGYVLGERIYFKTHVASGSSPTINKNGLGAKSLYKQASTGTTPLAVGDLGTNQMNVAEYDGSNYQMVSPISMSTAAFKNGTTTKNANDASTTQNIAHGLGISPKYVRLSAMCPVGTAGAIMRADTVYNGTTQSSISVYLGNSTTGIATTTFALSTQGVTGQNQTGVITFDATNIIITWTLNTNAAGNYNILWEAFA